jgi:hypothetical protein
MQTAEWIVIDFGTVASPLIPPSSLARQQYRESTDTSVECCPQLSAYRTKLPTIDDYHNPSVFVPDSCSLIFQTG